MKKTYEYFINNFYFCDFTLGKFYKINGIDDIFQFIKTTNKGFNMLNTRTSKCFFIHKQLYSKDLSGKDIPEDQRIFKSIPMRKGIIFKEIPCQL